jgi:hypothetical protein
MLADTNPCTRTAAATALLGMGDSIDLVLPMISDVLTHSNYYYSSSQTKRLEELGSAALPAVPVLVKTLDSTNDDLRIMVTNALRSIDPQGAAKHGVR